MTLAFLKKKFLLLILVSEKDPLPSAPPNSCYSAAAMHDGGNLEDASHVICLGVCLQVCMLFHRWVCVPVMAVMHEEHDLKIKQQAVVCTTVVTWRIWLTVGGQQEVGCILLRKPSDFVDLLLNLQTLQVIKLGFVALECAVNVVLSSTLRLALTLKSIRANPASDWPAFY